MPKVTYSALVESASGKLGGSILKGVKSGSILRRGQTPRKPRSAKQQETRGLYNTYAGKWYALTATEKALWNKFASLLPEPITGLNAYIQHNVRLLKAGHTDLSAITAPPSSPSTPEHIVGHELLRIAATTMRYQWTGPSDTSHWVELFWAVAAGYSFEGKQKWQHVDTTRSDDNYIEWTNNYPLETPIHVRARTIDVFGRISPWTDVLIWEHGVPAPIGAGCALYLPMDEGQGTWAMDHSGEGNHGQIVGASWVPGKYKHALSFDDLDDFVNCGHGSSLNITAAVTIEARIKPITSPSTNRGIIGKNDSGAYIYYYGLSTSFGNFARGAIKVGGIHYYTVSDAIPALQWSHLCMTYDRETMKYFLDGGLQQENSSPSGNLNSAPNNNVYISYTSGDRFQMIMDEARIYSRVLTPNEIYDHSSHLQ